MVPELVTAPTSASLLDGLKTLDSEAWRQMVELYGPLVYGWGRRAHLRAEDARDIVQEVFYAVATHVADFQRPEGNGGFRAWLFTITRNKIRDFLRRQSGEPSAPGGTAAYERLCREPCHEAGVLPVTTAASDQVQLVRRAVCLVRAEFEERTWEMFCRAAMVAEKPQKIATDFHVSVAAVYQAKSRVLRRLREILDGGLG